MNIFDKWQKREDVLDKIMVSAEIMFFFLT